jgi:hypothetical protein
VSVGRKSPLREDLSVKAEESTPLEAVTRERIVESLQGGKGLAGAVVIREFW